MRQTLAILLDAYRELNARKLFWITLMISGMVVVAFAMIGIDEDGLTFLGWSLPLPLNTSVIARDTFYKTIFVNFGIAFWLAWLATILALVTTAGMVPDFISGGAIDLVLAKPIGRARLFLTKYAAGLLFVALQVTVFSVCSFLVLGLRGGTWEPGVLLAVPLVVIFFSYLFSACVLIGLITRSTISALLLTLLVWLFIFGIHATESGLMAYRISQEQRITSLDKSILRSRTTLERAQQAEGRPSEALVESTQRRLDEWTADRDDARERLENAHRYHRLALVVKTCMPKTSETIGLLERWLIDLAELPQTPDTGSNAGDMQGMASPEFQRAVIDEVRGRSVTWILGTSLLFEAFVLAIATWIFARRDF